jgi:hypothetical protein
LLECFGESTFLNVPSFEYLGDIYAGFSNQRSSENAIQASMSKYIRKITTEFEVIPEEKI